MLLRSWQSPHVLKQSITISYLDIATVTHGPAKPENHNMEFQHDFGTPNEQAWQGATARHTLKNSASYPPISGHLNHQLQGRSSHMSSTNLTIAMVEYTMFDD